MKMVDDIEVIIDWLPNPAVCVGDVPVQHKFTTITQACECFELVYGIGQKTERKKIIGESIANDYDGVRIALYGVEVNCRFRSRLIPHTDAKELGTFVVTTIIH